jgi:2,3-dihydroxy-2,3-dihydro-p-cumate dehydrogenase
MEMQYEGKVALVTGAASPIGQAIARRLADGGANLVLADVDATALGAFTADLSAPFVSMVGDLSDEAVVDRLVALGRDAFGRIDILVNNAGGGVILLTAEHTSATVKRTIDRNLYTTIWCTRAVLPLMVAQDYGRIINIGADSVRNGLWMHTMYNAAKGGVHAIVSGLAREFAEYDITANVVAPCMVETPVVAAARASGNPVVAKMESVVPKGRTVTPDEVASLACYLALDEARFITGQVISINGGSTMQ